MRILLSNKERGDTQLGMPVFQACAWSETELKTLLASPNPKGIGH
jgi:hypothetical protein